MALKKQMTEADNRALSKCPEGWFSLDDQFLIIKNPYYRLQRLEEFGVVESRVEGPIDNLTRYWKKKDA